MDDGFDGCVLSDDALVDLFAEMKEFCPLGFGEFGDGDAGPLGDDVRDFVLGDFEFNVFGVFVLEFFRDFREFRLEGFHRAVLEFGKFFKIIGAFGFFHLVLGLVDFFLDILESFDVAFFFAPDGEFFVKTGLLTGEVFLEDFLPLEGARIVFASQGGAFDLKLQDLSLHLVECLGHGVDLGPDHGTRFVDEVDRLVRQKSVGDIAIAHDGGLNDGFVGDADAVVNLIFFLDAA